MKSILEIGVRFALLALMAVAGCDDEGQDEFDIVGDWLRTRTLQVGNRTEVDTWKISFAEDGTFTEVHMETDDLDNDPFVPQESRQGTYNIDKHGNVTLTGQWLDMTGGSVDSLGELGENMYGYQRQVMSIRAPGGDMIFIGPDVLHFSNWPYSQSYDLLYKDAENNTLTREFTLELVDGESQVLEQRIESFQFQVSANGCGGQYSLVTILQGIEEQSSGQFTECGYAVTEAVEVEDVDGSIVQVQAVTFTYEAEGLTGTQQEFYIQVGDHYLGYNPSEQATALRNSAFVRVTE
jgi:hypothetical protein